MLALYWGAIFALLSTVSGLTVKFTDCGSSASVQNVDITPCTAEPCPIVRGQSTTFGIGFTTTAPAKTVTAAVAGKVFGAWISWPVGQTDACKDCGLSCPLSANQNYAYLVTIPIASWYPPIGELEGRFELQDENTKDIVCVTMQLVLQTS